MRRLSGLATLLLIAMAPPGAPGGSAPGVTTHTVEIRNFVFSPARLEVAAGDTILWINRDAAPHTATDSAGQWDSGELAAGERWRWVAGEAGRFSYLCLYHPSMTGTLTVRAAKAAPQSTGRPSDNAWEMP